MPRTGSGSLTCPTCGAGRTGGILLQRNRRLHQVVAGIRAGEPRHAPPCHNGGEQCGGHCQPCAARPDHQGRQRIPIHQPRIQVIGGRAGNHPRIHLRQHTGAERAYRVLPHLCIQFPACGAARRSKKSTSDRASLRTCKRPKRQCLPHSRTTTTVESTLRWGI